MSPTLEIVCLYVKLYMSVHLHMLFKPSLAYTESLFFPLPSLLKWSIIFEHQISLSKNTYISYLYADPH